MNAFYKRLMRFGELITHASQQENHNLADYFTVLHPGFPVVSATRSTTPKLTFSDGVPTEVRRTVRKLFKKSFRRESVRH